MVLETQLPMTQGNVTNMTGMNTQNPFMNTAVSPAASAQPSANLSAVSPAQMQVGNMSVYPEVFYKIQPYIMLACDQMDTLNPAMPTQEMAEQMSDNIYDAVTRTYPEMAEYARSADTRASGDPEDAYGPAVEAVSFGVGPGFGPGMGFGRRFPFRRRGVFRDLIDILLLQELFRRRRRRFY